MGEGAPKPGSKSIQFPRNLAFRPRIVQALCKCNSEKPKHSTGHDMFIHTAIIQDSSVPLDALWMICPLKLSANPILLAIAQTASSIPKRRRGNNLAVSYEQHQNLNCQSQSLMAHTSKTDTWSRMCCQVWSHRPGTDLGRDLVEPSGFSQ